ncbi:MAG TPA: riboflavin biosynthesis protein RibF [Ferruginibacter sp.]|nr:riboflavin biosynthesis protein RibF [Chitinophagaceae bacterium]HRI23105.1 riboflavin biosynthesis protein RibF [Ferruginibacter sp.]
MQIHRDISQLPSFRNAVITIGTFDGVHLGHHQIIDSLKQEAATAGGESVIITFHPHPRKVVSSVITGVRLINTLAERIELLDKTGIDHLVIVPFTDYFANQTAEEYIRDFLVEKFRPHTIIIGYDHRFGKERAGDYKMMEEKAAVYNYKLKEISEHILDAIKVSSTNIRNAILHSNVEEANHLLGYTFFFEGEVFHGDKIGRELGYPTANLKSTDEEKIVMGDGIYAVHADVEGIRYKGMMSIGFRPTVNGRTRVTEVNLFDFNKDIYGKTIRVHVQKYLRSEVKFNGLEELKEQLHKDKEESLKYL